jgi:elongation factor P
MSNKISSLEIKKGMVYKYENNLYECVDCTIISGAFSRRITKIKVIAKNVLSGSMVQTIFIRNDYVEQVDLLERKLMFLYDDGNNLCFLDSDTYDTIEVSNTNFKWEKNFLTANLDVSCLIFENEIIKIVLPDEVCLTINSCDAIDSSKPVKSAICGTGLKVNVPIFINAGESIYVSTLDGTYKGRV